MNDLLRHHNYKKQFGQNFITDENFLRAIVTDAGVANNDTVIEIGAGAGTLTAKIADVAKKVIAFEIDRDLAPILAETLKNYENVEIIYKDILKVEEQELTGFAPYSVVANLPYYITAPVILKFLESTVPPKTLTVMLQKEVAERIVAKPNTPEYGVFTLLTEMYGKAEIVRVAPRNLFFPTPKVDSAIIKITVEPKFSNEKAFKLKKLIKAAFAMRRKTLVNNLTHAGYDKTKALSVLETMQIPCTVRGEALTLLQYSTIADYLP